jgi:dTDP-4-amino-4,6-dideoxygalactose transaminase
VVSERALIRNMTYRIPFNKPSLTGKEITYITDAICRGHSAGDGYYSACCHRLLEAKLGADRAFLTTSCTDALEMAALLLDIQPGDEFIVPSFTFVSTANAFVMRGARPVFCDIRSDTLNLDEKVLPALLTERTRAIIPVHYAGVGCDMPRIIDLASGAGCNVVEDNAHGLFTKSGPKYLGTYGCLGTQSFHETKNVICGEGGALIINNPDYVERAEILREKGTNRSRYFRGQVDKYTWVDLGSSYLPSDLLAAFLLAQLEAFEQIQERRSLIWHRYDDGLREWARGHGVRQPYIPHGQENAYHMYYLIMPSLQSRQALIDHLKKEGILAVFHYVPLHTSDMGMKFGGCKSHCPVTESISGRLLRLPFYNTLAESEQLEVIEHIQQFRPPV